VSALALSAVAQAAIRAVDPARVLDLARSALRIKSLSGEEEDVARFFVGAMRDAGLEAELQPVPATSHMGASFNALGRLRGRGTGPSLMLNGHLDHNPVCEGWTRDPYAAVVEDGWLYGFVHMKAACAGYIAAVEAVRHAFAGPLDGDVVLALVCGELRGGAGTQHALSQGLRTDYFLLGEPTELDFALSHTASIVARIHALGRMKHFATVPTAGARGVNAVEKMAPVIAALGRSHTPMRACSAGGWLEFAAHEDFTGLPQINIGPIRGGIGRDHDASRPALFPDRCTLTVDFRTVPGMTKESIRRDLDRLLAGISARDPDFRYEIEFASDTFPLPFAGARSSPLLSALRAAHRSVQGSEVRESEVLKFAASDASWLGAAGIQGVVYGPAGRYLSRPDERCEIRDLVAMAQVYAGVLAEICGGGKGKG
jgi:acetylornithine deacetylase